MSSIKKNFFKHVDTAIAHNKTDDKKKKSLSLTYKKLNGRIIKRKVSPIEMKGTNLLAYDHKRRAVRSFKMERVKNMEKSAFWNGFEKQAWHNAAEIAGLGTLAAPTIQAMRGKPMSEKNTHRAELAGLGILAAPAVASVAKKVMKRG